MTFEDPNQKPNQQNDDMTPDQGAKGGAVEDTADTNSEESTSDMPSEDVASEDTGTEEPDNE